MSYSVNVIYSGELNFTKVDDLIVEYRFNRPHPVPHTNFIGEPIYHTNLFLLSCHALFFKVLYCRTSVSMQCPDQVQMVYAETKINHTSFQLKNCELA